MALLKTNVQTNVSRRLTGRRVRERQFALSCPPQSLVLSAHSPNFRLPRKRRGLRQNAIPVIAVAPRVTDARTGRPEDVLAWKIRRKFG